jgi:hypothetical protein
LSGPGQRVEPAHWVRLLLLIAVISAFVVCATVPFLADFFVT